MSEIGQKKNSKTYLKISTLKHWILPRTTVYPNFSKKFKYGYGVAFSASSQTLHFLWPVIIGPQHTYTHSYWPPTHIHTLKNCNRSFALVSEWKERGFFRVDVIPGVSLTLGPWEKQGMRPMVLGPKAESAHRCQLRSRACSLAHSSLNWVSFAFLCLVQGIEQNLCIIFSHFM